MSYAPDKVKYGPFRRIRASNSEGFCQSWTNFEQARDFMPVLVILKYDDNPIKTEALSSKQHFPHYTC